MRLRSLLRTLPEGTLAVGLGILASGLGSYGFLVLSGRALGPQRYGALSVLWALIFLAGPGFFFPLEQEVSRALAARRVVGLGGRPLVIRAAMAGGIMALALLAAIWAGANSLLEHLFDGQSLLLIGFAISLMSYFVQHTVRGVLSGTGRFGAFGGVVAADGLLRFGGAVVLLVLGVKVAGPYGLVLGLAPILACAVALRGLRGWGGDGPAAPWGELSSALGFLLAGAVLAQFLVNAGPVAVKLFSGPNQDAAAGRFLAGLVVARVPLTLFQAVQVALLPKLSALAGSGARAEFRHGIRRIVLTVGVFGALVTAGAYATGPWFVRTFFGAGFVLGRVDLAYLAGGSAAYMLALSMAQALIALSAYAKAALGWLAGVVVFIAVVAARSGLLAGVEAGYLWGSLVAAAGMSLMLFKSLTQVDAVPHAIDATVAVPLEP